ncbi:MAG: Zn-ribbon domain-containing OB-fold protein [Candidatus Methanomethyliaceae archaeon]|nr:Zn-ribbon domain-containing OB-fold protein [Candidatus Methanomethyliaceae archaeon]
MSVPRYWREMPYRIRLEARKCKLCNYVNYPPRTKCYKCGASEFEKYYLPQRGILLSFSIIRNPPTGFEKTTPYVIGLVELEDGTKLLTQITDVDIDEIKIGMELEQVFRRISEDGDSGIIQYGIKFRPKHLKF